MKKAITSIVLVSIVLLGACKKDNVNPEPEKKYTINVLRNNVLFKKYIYTPTKLLQFNHYELNGKVADSAVFYYSSGRLDSMVNSILTYNYRLTTQYVYDSGNRLVKIEEAKGHYYEKVYDITYDNKDRIRKVVWSMKNKPFSGEYSVNAYGNVDNYKYNRVDAVGSHYETHTLSFEQFKNAIQPFWVMSPDEISLSINNSVEQIINTQTDPIGGSQMIYQTELQYYKYTYNTEGYVLTKTVLDTNNQTTDFYEYQYLEN